MEFARAIICALGYEEACNELGGPSGNVHGLQNVMTLASGLKGLFDRQQMWFEATVAPSRFLFPHIYK